MINEDAVTPVKHCCCLPRLNGGVAFRLSSATIKQRRMSWRKVNIGSFLKRRKQQIEIQSSTEYKRITIKTKHQGISLRDKEKGSLIGTKLQFTVNLCSMFSNPLSILKDWMQMKTEKILTNI